MAWSQARLLIYGLLGATAFVNAVPYAPPSVEARDVGSQPVCVPISPLLQNADDLMAKVTGSCPKDEFPAPGPSTSPAPFGIARFAAATTGDYACNENKPCSNGACCGKSGYCGYGEKYCGTNGESPNEVCWSNCDAHAECGRFADPKGKECPLNVCCSPYGFCGMTEEFCKQTDDPDTSCQSNCKQPGSGSSGGNVQKRIIGYYEAWNRHKKCINMGIQDIPVASLTHIYYSFGFIHPDSYDIIPMQGEDEPVSTDTFTEFAALKRLNPSVKVIMALGGWSFNNNDTIWQPVFGDLASTKEKRTKFIGKVEDFLTTYGFDGIDIDWEYPGAGDRGGHKGDGENYTKLLKELRVAFDKHEGRELSFTAPTSYWYMRHFDIKGSVEAANFVNLMAYDLHGVWDANNPIGPHILAHTNLTEIDNALDLLWRNDVDAGKVNLGLAFYGRSFQLADPSCYKPGCLFKGGGSPGRCTDSSGTLSYNEIMDIIDENDLTPYYDKENAVKWVTWSGNQWVSFDDQDTFQQKIEYANALGLGGLLIWALDLDTTQLDALAAVIYPKQLGQIGAQADSVNNWVDATGGQCYRTECGLTGCKPGWVRIDRSPCSSPDFWGDVKECDICCPFESAPDPKKCQWRGRWPFCNGRCHTNEVTLLFSSFYGDISDKCWDGRKFFCCTATDEVPDCRWTDCGGSCNSEENDLTWKNTGCLYGQPKRFCCNKEEEWRNCAWHGKPGSCFDDHCDTDKQVTLATSWEGEGESCGYWHQERKRSFCCDPPKDSTLFMPVPLDYLFRDPPAKDDADTDFTLKVDPTYGGSTDDIEFAHDPENSAFGFVVLTSPDELQVSLDKRDGSHWEVFDCFDPKTEGEHTVRMMCSDLSETSNCGKIHLGHGAPGTIVQMPRGCGPGKYAVTKSMEPSKNQSLPGHLSRRGLTAHDTIYDLTFDYNFRRVPRDMGHTLMRIDYSNQMGYWNTVVDKAANTKKRRKRSLHEANGNHRRWLEEEWRDDAHFGALSKEDLHKRWFGSDIIEWLKRMIGVVEADFPFGHSFTEDFVLKIVDEELNCPNVNAHLDVHAETHLDAQVNYGLTLIAKLGDDIDFTDSYLYFRSRGEATAKFVVDGAVTAFFNTGDVNLFSADKFGGAFAVPGIVTIGPNFKLFGQIEGAATLGVNFESRVKLVDWDIHQTYPVANDKWDPEARDAPSKDGTQEMMEPEFSYGLSLSGHLTAHVKPTVSFGIDFNRDFIDIDSCAVNMVADGHITFHADASTGSGGTSFCYGIDAGADLYATIDAPKAFDWALPKSPFPIIPIDDVQIYPSGDSPACWTPSSSKNSRRSINARRNASELALATLPELASADGSSPVLTKRAQVYGPLVPKLEGLSCPGNIDVADVEACPYCVSGSSDGKLAARDGETCWYDPDSRGTPCPSDDGTVVHALEKRDKKEVKWPYGNRDLELTVVNFPSCGKAIKKNSIKKWYGFKDGNGQCAAIISKIDDASAHKSDYVAEHVYEAQSMKRFMLFLAGKEGSLPKGYTAGTYAWVSEVLIGLGGGSSKHSAASWDGRSLWEQMARNIGSTQNPEGLVIADRVMNGKKGKFFEASQPTSKNAENIRETKLTTRGTAGVFSYMRNRDIWAIFKESSQGMEQALHEFDTSYDWGSSNEALKLPKRGKNQPKAGLRDLYCYWIDFELARIETAASVWQTAAKTEFEKGFKGSDAAAWLSLFSSGPLSQSELKFERATVPHKKPNPSKPDIWAASNYDGLWKTGSGYGAAGPF